MRSQLGLCKVQGVSSDGEIEISKFPVLYYYHTDFGLAERPHDVAQECSGQAWRDGRRNS